MLTVLKVNENNNNMDALRILRITIMLLLVAVKAKTNSILLPRSLMTDDYNNPTDIDRGSIDYTVMELALSGSLTSEDTGVTLPTMLSTTTNRPTNSSSVNTTTSNIASANTTVVHDQMLNESTTGTTTTESMPPNDTQAAKDKTTDQPVRSTASTTTSTSESMPPNELHSTNDKTTDQPVHSTASTTTSTTESMTFNDTHVAIDKTAGQPLLSKTSSSTAATTPSISSTETTENTDNESTTTKRGGLVRANISPPVATIIFPVTVARRNLTTNTTRNDNTTTTGRSTSKAIVKETTTKANIGYSTTTTTTTATEMSARKTTVTGTTTKANIHTTKNTTTTTEMSARKTTVTETTTKASISYPTTTITTRINTSTTKRNNTERTTNLITTARSFFTTRNEMYLSTITSSNVVVPAGIESTARNNIGTTTDVSYISSTEIDNIEITINGQNANELRNKTTTVGISEAMFTPEISKRPLKTNKLDKSTDEYNKLTTPMTTVAMEKYTESVLESQPDVESDVIPTTSGSTSTKRDDSNPVNETETTTQLPSTTVTYNIVTNTTKKSTTSLQSTTQKTQHITMTTAPQTTDDLYDGEPVIEKEPLTTTYSSATFNYTTDSNYRNDALDGFGNMLLIAVTIIGVFFIVPLIFAMVCLIIQKHKKSSRTQIKHEITELE